jgi:hypothetical protein
MNRFLTLLILLAVGKYVFAGDATIQSRFADSDAPLTTDVKSSFWQGSPPIYMDRDTRGKRDPKYRTEIRTRWTENNLYFLFICPYEELNLKPQPSTTAETYELWNWDVAEAFIGADFQNIRRYKEFEISPQGEWVDLDIDLDKPHHEDGWKWNSGFGASARIDRAAQTWYGAMRIPYSSIDMRPARAGNVLRINLFRSQGRASARHAIAWQAPMKNSFHVPERFGLLKLVKSKEGAPK